MDRRKRSCCKWSTVRCVGKITFMVRSCLRFKNERKTVKFYKYSIFKIVVINSGVGLYFSCVFYIWDVWDMAEKNTQSWRAKFRFSPIAPGYTSTGLRINQNLVEDLFLCILYNLEIKRTLFGKDRKKIPIWCFLPKPKSHHRPFESYKMSSNHPIGLKIYQHTQIEKGFQNCYKTWESERVIIWPAWFLAITALKIKIV